MMAISHLEENACSLITIHLHQILLIVVSHVVLPNTQHHTVWYNTVPHTSISCCTVL